MNRISVERMAPENRLTKLHAFASEDDIQVACSRYRNWNNLDTAWKEFAQDLHLLTSSRLALTFQYDESSTELITKGVSGLSLAISRTVAFLGIELLQKRWPLYDGVMEDLLKGNLIQLESIAEVSSYNLSNYQSFYIQKVMGIEAIYSMGLLGRNGGLLGNFVLLLGRTLENEKMCAT